MILLAIILKNLAIVGKTVLAADDQMDGLGIYTGAMPYVKIINVAGILEIVA